MGTRVTLWELLFFYCLGLAVAASCKVTGSILAFCYLTVPPVVGLLLSKRLVPVILISVLTALISTLAGIYISFKQDLPTNQIVCAVILSFLTVSGLLRFFLSLSLRRRLQ
jgi:manganese transport system permease protein